MWPQVRLQIGENKFVDRIIFPHLTCLSGDGEVVEQVISQQTAEHEQITIRRSSLLDEAIRQLQEQQDRQNQPDSEAAPGSGAEGQAEAHGPALAPAPSTPRRGMCEHACRFTEQQNSIPELIDCNGECSLAGSVCK